MENLSDRIDEMKKDGTVEKPPEDVDASVIDLDDIEKQLQLVAFDKVLSNIESEIQNLNAEIVEMLKDLKKREEVLALLKKERAVLAKCKSEDLSVEI